MKHITTCKILCLHQGAELYGSDRSFLSVIQYLVQQNDIEVEVVLPITGPLVDELIAIGVVPKIISGGVIRKKELKVNPLRFLWTTFRAAIKLRKLMRKADIIYVNTIVYIAAYLAGATLPPQKQRWAHIREIHSPLVCRIFLAFYKLGRFQRIYNSLQTRIAFNDPYASVVHNGVRGPQSITLPTEKGTILKVLLLGRINTWKGHEFSLKALEKHLEHPEDVELTIVGDAFQGYEGLVDSLRKLVEHYMLRTRFHSFTTDPSSYFTHCDLVLIPSTLPEPFGRVAVEAFSYGRPVIAANHGGLTEIVTHGETGYLFKPNNAKSLVENIQKYLEKDIEERQLMSLNSRKRYEELFSEARYTSAIKDLLLHEEVFYDS